MAPDVGWVYRESETASPTVNDVAAKEVVAELVTEVRTAPPALTVVKWPEREIPREPAVVYPPPDPARLAMMAGMGALAFGVLTTGLASLVVVGMIAGPVLAARRLLAVR